VMQENGQRKPQRFLHWNHRLIGASFWTAVSVALIAVIVATVGARHSNSKRVEADRSVEVDASPSLRASRKGANVAAEAAAHAANE
jgi:hypothetical protein